MEDCREELGNEAADWLLELTSHADEWHRSYDSEAMIEDMFSP